MSRQPFFKPDWMKCCKCGTVAGDKPRVFAHTIIGNQGFLTFSVVTCEKCWEPRVTTLIFENMVDATNEQLVLAMEETFRAGIRTGLDLKAAKP